MSGASAWVWRGAAGSARLACWLLYASAAVSLCSAAVGLAVAPSEKTLDAPLALFGLVQIALFIATALAVLRWLYVANGNARSLGADDLTGSPAWAVGWFFVPLANLVMPYVMVRDMWKASVNPRDWQAESSPGLVILWWGCWLVSQIASTIAFRLELEMGMEASDATRMLGLASDLVSIPSALLLAMIIGRIQAQQVNARPATIF